MAKRKRVRAREIALQAVYQFDLSRRRGDSESSSAMADLDAFLEERSEDDQVKRYARHLVEGCVGSFEKLDARIAATARHWTLQRIAPVDLSILRIALFEMLEVEDVPPKVAINEAIELAKKFSTAQSGAFVNGILDRLYQEIARGTQPPATTEDKPDSPGPRPPHSTDQDSNDAEEVVR